MNMRLAKLTDQQNLRRPQFKSPGILPANFLGIAALRRNWVLN